MDASLCMRDKRPFEMDAHRLCFRKIVGGTGGLDGVRYAFERPHCPIDGRRDCRREIMCNSFGSKKAPDSGKRLWSSLHRVVACRSMDRKSTRLNSSHA